jgi:outer membrane protein TolC
MRKTFMLCSVAAALVVCGSIVVAKQEAAATSQAPTAVTPSPTAAVVLPSATPIVALPISTPIVTPTPLGSTPAFPSPTPIAALGSPTPATAPSEPSLVTTSNTFEWSEKGAPVFTIDAAILTALQQNPDILRAKQEIERTRGVILQIAALALPHLTPNATFNFTDPKLLTSEPTSTTTLVVTGGPSPSPSPPFTFALQSAPTKLTQYSYQINVTGSQLVFNYGTFRQIRGTFFQRDSAYFAFRNTIDGVIANVTTQFYQVILNRALIGVQEQSVRLLESQLKDQQNRFEAGTVPRFNVLQAQVQLSNQIPNLIAARNAYRISILQLAKTLGIDYNPARGIAAPIRVVGELAYVPRNISLFDAIETGKRNRPFLKQARANVLNAIEQVHVAIGNFIPNFTSTGGYEVISSPFNTSIDDVMRGWVFGLQGNWNLWDSGETYGLVKQQRALLSEAKITYDDDVRQVELEIQQAASNVLQNRELIQATEKTVEQADESVRLAKARLDAGAGTQLDVLNAQVQLTTAQSTRLQALFGYISSVAEFDRATGAQTSYTEVFDQRAPRATRSRTYYTGSDVDATGKRKPANPFAPGVVRPMSQESSGK